MTEYLGETSVAEDYMFIKEFEFTPSIGVNPSEGVEFSDSTLIRLNPSETPTGVRLRKLDTGYYSTASDIWFRTWTVNPKSLRKLMMIQVFGEFPTDTSIQVRLYDGSDHYYWDGATWSVAGAGNWNSEADFNAHIQEFAILPNRTFAIVVNLITTDKYVTPKVTEIRVLMQIKIDYFEDLIFRSLIPTMKAGIRPVANFPLPGLPASSSTIDLNDYNLDTGFNITDVDSVFNFSTDSELLTDLLDNYNPTTKVITLTSPIGQDEIPFVLFRYEPEFAYTTDQDNVEVAKIPAFVIQRLEVPTQQAYNLNAREAVIDKGTGDGYQINEPWRLTFEFRIEAQADNPVDMFRMMSALLKFLDDNRRIRSIGLDEYYRLQIVRELRDLIQPNRADKLKFWTQFNLMDVRMPLSWKQVKGVTRLVLTFKEPMPPKEDPLLGGSRIVFTTHTDDGPSTIEESFEITE